MTRRQAIVRLDGRPVGRLVEEGAQITFQYDAAWLATPGAVPVSLTLPLRLDPWVVIMFAACGRSSILRPPL